MRNTYTPGAYLLLTGSPVASTVATVSGTGTAASAAGLRGNGDGRSRIYLAASARIDADYHSGAAGWTIGLSLEAHGLEHEFGGDVVSASGDIRHSDLEEPESGLTRVIRPASTVSELSCSTVKLNLPSYCCSTLSFD